MRSAEHAGSIIDLIIKGGLGMAVAVLLGLVLYMAHEETLEDTRKQEELVKFLITQCFKERDVGVNFDRIIELQEMAQLEKDIAHMDALVEADDAAGN